MRRIGVSSSRVREVLLTSSSTSQGSVTEYLMYPSNIPLLTSLLAISIALAQFLKLFTSWFKEKRWDSKRILSSGGMPSSHSAGVSALAVAIGLQEGTGASAFALAVVMACVVLFGLAVSFQVRDVRIKELARVKISTVYTEGVFWLCQLSKGWLK